VKTFTRITVDPTQMGGLPCIRGLRIPVATVVGMVSEGMPEAEILSAYPDLEVEDVREALRRDSWLTMLYHVCWRERDQRNANNNERSTSPSRCPRSPAFWNVCTVMVARIVGQQTQKRPNPPRLGQFSRWLGNV
jgi:uncharacterized protein (DUF433 family)